MLYTYDAWGKILGIKDAGGNEIVSDTHIGRLNSLRYRGYYYDTEIGLYYLQSRYYNPEIKRFLNADTIIAEVGNLNNVNMFAYCNNNPVNMIDTDGNFSIPVDIKILALIVTGVIFVLNLLYRVSKNTIKWIISHSKVNSATSSKVKSKSKRADNSKVKDKIEKKGLPTEGEIQFKPKGKDLKYNNEEGGYEDKDGNIWRKGPYHGDPNKGYTYEWDVELSQKGVNKWGEYLKPGKDYINVRPDGKISH